MSDRAPNMTEKLAATILAWQRALGAPIPREHAQAMTADQICSLIEFDHYPVRRVDGGTTHPDNLEPRFIAAHAEKTAKTDVPQIRKADRLATAKAALDLYLATGEKPPLPNRRTRKIPSRPFSKQHRPLRSRSSFERRAP